MEKPDSYSRMTDYKLGTIDTLALSGGSSLNSGIGQNYRELQRNTAEYLLRYGDAARAISVAIEELHDGTTAVKLVERILPQQRKKPDSIVSRLIHKGKAFLTINYEALAAATPVERRCMVHVPSVQSMDEFIDVAVEAAGLLMRQYATTYLGDKTFPCLFDQRILENRIITRLLKTYG